MLKVGSVLDKTTILKDANGNTLKVPGGFKISQDSANKVDDGVVIEDEKGNQFVWIPVNSLEQYTRNKSFEVEAITAIAYDDSDYLPSGITNEEQAVLRSGGFYIGRYEAGNEDGQLVVKKNIYPWAWSTPASIKSMSKGLVNNSYAKSALISGRQWDRVMSFVDGKNDGTGVKFDVRVRKWT